MEYLRKRFVDGFAKRVPPDFQVWQPSPAGGKNEVYRGQDNKVFFQIRLIENGELRIGFARFNPEKRLKAKYNKAYQANSQVNCGRNIKRHRELERAETMKQFDENFIDKKSMGRKV